MTGWLLFWTIYLGMGVLTLVALWLLTLTTRPRPGWWRCRETVLVVAIVLLLWPLAWLGDR